MGFKVVEYIQCHSSNFDYGRGGYSVDHLAIHYTGTNASARNNLLYFSGPNRNASAHYFVDKDGSCYQSISERDTAWAVGNYAMNQRSISIECISDGSGPFTPAQIATVRAMTQDICARYGISKSNVIRHYDVTGKHCPAQYVDNSAWNKLHAQITSTANVEAKWIFNHDVQKWWWRRSDESYPVNQWEWINQHWYHFDSHGYMETGWLWINNKCYYLIEAADGSQGQMVTGLQTIEGLKYFFADTGELKFGWVKLDGKWKFFDRKWGVLQTGWIKDNDNWYYLDQDGTMLTGHQNIGGVQYYFVDSGEMFTGIYENGDETYLFDSSGAMVQNTVHENPNTNTISVFDHDGKMLKGGTVTLRIDDLGNVTTISERKL